MLKLIIGLLLLYFLLSVCFGFVQTLIIYATVSICFLIVSLIIDGTMEL